MTFLFRFTSLFFWNFSLLGKGYLYCTERSNVSYWALSRSKVRLTYSWFLLVLQ